MPINLYSKDSVDDLLDAKLSISSLSNAATATLNAGVPTAGQALTYDGTDLIWATVSGSFNGGTVTNPITVDESAGSGFISTLSGAQLSFDGTGCYISGEETTIWGFSSLALSASGTIGNVGSITFSDSTVQTTAAVAGVTSDKAIANAFAASMWYAWDGYDRARNGVVNTNYIGGSYLSAGISDGTTFAAGFPATNATLDTGSYWYVSINGTLSDLFIYSP